MTVCNDRCDFPIEVISEQLGHFGKISRVLDRLQYTFEGDVVESGILIRLVKVVENRRQI